MLTVFRKIKSFIKLQKILYKQVERINHSYFDDIKSIRLNLGQIQAHTNSLKESINNLSEVEFRVFSQWGDDGIIQYLISKIDFPNKTFIEFGVESYEESNTRFLLLNNDWSGYVIDGSNDHINYIKNDSISWACELHTEASFITAENINQLLVKPNFDPEVGILSIDIDGNDYWVWKEISVINPIVVIVEYNSIFGINNAWTVPYDPNFVKYQKHSSIIYYGASLKAFHILAQEKGYQFIGCNTKGNNAYFIRNDKMPKALESKTIKEGYVLSKFREAMNNGRRPIGKERIELINGLEVFDVEKSHLIKIDSKSVLYA